MNHGEFQESERDGNNRESPSFNGPCFLFFSVVLACRSENYRNGRRRKRCLNKASQGGKSLVVLRTSLGKGTVGSGGATRGAARRGFVKVCANKGDSLCDSCRPAYCPRHVSTSWRLSEMRLNHRHTCSMARQCRSDIFFSLPLWSRLVSVLVCPPRHLCRIRFVKKTNKDFEKRIFWTFRLFFRRTATWW